MSNHGKHNPQYLMTKDSIACHVHSIYDFKILPWVTTKIHAGEYINLPPARGVYYASRDPLGILKRVIESREEGHSNEFPVK